MGREVTLIPDAVWDRIRYCERASTVVDSLACNPRPLSLEQAASIACMERTSFCRLFKRKTGMGFYRFLIAYRIELAITRMGSCDRNLCEIASDVGFGSSSTFRRCFKDALGVSPTEYRAKQIESRNCRPRSC